MNSTEKTHRTRVTLTKSVRSSEAGAELLKLLTGITDDGRISDAEISSLRAWLAQARSDFSDIPAIAALRDVVEEALADGTVTNDERREIVGIILRILPAEERKTADQKVKSAASKTGRIYYMKPGPEPEPEPEPGPKSGSRAGSGQRSGPRPPRMRPATEPQLAYLRALNVSVDEATITKEEASAEIELALNSSAGVSNRQMMVLRFWNNVAIANRGRRAVSDWMDQWYSEDPDRIAAWELWKEAHGDCGRQVDPACVPLGAGFEWIKKVRPQDHPGFIGKRLLVAAFMVSVTAAAYYSCARNSGPASGE